VKNIAFEKLLQRQHQQKQNTKQDGRNGVSPGKHICLSVEISPDTEHPGKKNNPQRHHNSIGHLRLLKNTEKDYIYREDAYPSF
jgi:hypothetical protein